MGSREEHKTSLEHTATKTDEAVELPTVQEAGPSCYLNTKLTRAPYCVDGLNIVIASSLLACQIRECSQPAKAELGTEAQACQGRSSQEQQSTAVLSQPCLGSLDKAKHRLSTTLHLFLY